MPQAQLDVIPLVFSFRLVVMGRGFVAGVRMDGRALLESEVCGDRREEWVTGIAPVGIAGGGADRSVALFEFRKAWTEVVFDHAAEAESFDEFKALCDEFCSSKVEHLTALWRDAVAAVRKQGYTDQALRKGNADDAVRYEVVDLTSMNLATDVNEVEQFPQVAA